MKTLMRWIVIVGTLSGGAAHAQSITGAWQAAWPIPAPPKPIAADAPAVFEVSGPLHRHQEQLGLRLDSTKTPVDVLVVDRVERPSEN